MVGFTSMKFFKCAARLIVGWLHYLFLRRPPGIESSVSSISIGDVPQEETVATVSGDVRTVAGLHGQIELDDHIVAATDEQQGWPDRRETAIAASASESLGSSGAAEPVEPRDIQIGACKDAGSVAVAEAVPSSEDVTSATTASALPHSRIAGTEEAVEQPTELEGGRVAIHALPAERATFDEGHRAAIAEAEWEIAIALHEKPSARKLAPDIGSQGTKELRAATDEAAAEHATAEAQPVECEAEIHLSDELPGTPPVAPSSVASTGATPPMVGPIRQVPESTTCSVQSAMKAALPSIGDGFSSDQGEIYSERPAAPVQGRKPIVADTERQHDEEEDASKPSAGESARSVEGKSSERNPHNRFDVDVTEYPEGAELFACAQKYLYWNRLLFSRLIRPHSGGVIHLAISPRILAGIVSDDEGQGVPPTQAEERLTAAVREAYALAIECPARLKAFRCCSTEGGIPLCVGFLVLSILAAHKMHADEKSASSAYYARLAELLGVKIEHNDVPAGFGKEGFESLWLFLADWIEKRGHVTLALPDPGTQRPYVAYPLAHVPLRQLDLQKLPFFFDWAGYPAGSTVTAARISDDLKQWADIYGTLSQAGRAALNDERSAAVVYQARNELRAWDGSVPEADAQGPRFVHVEVLLEKIGRRLRLSLLAPRREGYPVILRSGEIELSGGDMWYEPLPIERIGGDPLLNGFIWQHEAASSKALRRTGERAIVLAPHPDYSGYVSRIQLPRNVRCAVLCHESLAKAAEVYLAGICDPIPAVLKDPSLPHNWLLFWGVKVVRRIDSVPEHLRALEVASEVEIVPQGGLRLGSHWVWMEGAPPRILIESAADATAIVDGAPVELDEEGYLKDDNMLSGAGVHTVSAGDIEKKIRIETPEIRYLCPEDAGEAAPVNRNPVILEQGSWTLIGSNPNQVDQHRNGSRHTTLVFCSFVPTWAIRFGTRSGARAIQLCAEGPAADFPVAHTTCAQRWVSVLYDAGIRHSELGAAPGTSEADVTARWVEYVRVAKKIKRQWKRRR